MLTRNQDFFRPFLAADQAYGGRTGVEDTAHRRVYQAGYSSRDRRQPFVPGFQAGETIDQAQGIRVFRLVKDIQSGTHFGQPPAIHHDYPVGDLGDRSQVMGDEQGGHISLLLQVPENLQNLDLYRGIKGSGRLIRDQDLRISRIERPLSSPFASSRRRTGGDSPSSLPAHGMPTCSIK